MTAPTGHRYPGTAIRPRRGDTVLLRNAEGYHFGRVTRARGATITVGETLPATFPITDVVQVELTRPGLLARLFRR